MFLLRFSLSLSLPFPLLFQGDESLVFFLVSFFCFPPKSWANVFGLAVRRGKGGGRFFLAEERVFTSVFMSILGTYDLK